MPVRTDMPDMSHGQPQTDTDAGQYGNQEKESQCGHGWQRVLKDG